MHYQSTVEYESRTCAGVKYTLRRVSLASRLELLQRVQHYVNKLDFLNAGNTTKESYEAAVVEKEIERAYLDWGLLGVNGLVIDNAAASAATLVEKGPEALTREILIALKQELGLKEDERKN
ncbi:MAG TPA: hypothetical protein VM120_28455 [Bryobacteraceae bacterium]|nr:hypothetical protein [Bryobacteraceae bacterium]